MSEKSLKEQKEIVKNNLRSQLKENDTWGVISSSWYKRWQKYVGFHDQLFRERSQEEIESFYPGPMENKDIALNEFELKKGLYEGIDVTFLPDFVTKYLYEIYGGDEPIYRKIAARGISYSRQLFIELYPLKLIIYLEKDVSSSDKPEPVKILYASSSQSIDDTLKELYQSLELNSKDCRIWIKKDNNDESNGTNNDDSDDDVNNSNNNNNNNNDNNVSLRKLTSDKTDVDGDWRFLRDISNQTLNELNLTTLSIMVEQMVIDPSTQKKYWPKDEVLNEWKYNLRRGDMCDAKDEFNTWYESVVSAVNIHSNTVTIHFKGWGKRFDRELEKNQLNSELAPLYSHVTNWRDSLKIYDVIDYTRNSEHDQSRKWLPAYVMAIDNVRGQLKLKYREDNGVISEVDCVDLYGESIAPTRTHVKSSFPNFGTYPVTGTRITSTTNYTTSSSSSNNYVSSNTSNYSNTGSNYGYSRYSSSWNTRSHATGTPPELGVVGLYNLGNTCFMNSMLQCLSNTKILTDCFLNDSYASQLNTQNPLGHGGKVASSYARLMKEIWSGKFTAVSPDDFKRTIGEFAPQFSGFQQQDSQELMLFLLDGLHEDLNRIISKPFVEKIESKGRDDELISKEAWRRFLLRNDSELVDKCFGQLRSHVTCTNCQYQSVTFDEYSSLSLPLPVKNTVNIEVTVYPLPFGSTPIKLNVEVDTLLNVKDFKQIVISKLNFTPESKKRKTNEESSDNNSTQTSSDRELDSTGDFVIVTPPSNNEGVNECNDDNNNNNNDNDNSHVYKEINSKYSPTQSDIDDLADLSDKEDQDEDDNENENNNKKVGDTPVIINNESPKKSRRVNDKNNEEISTTSNKLKGGFFHVCEVGSTRTGGRIMKTFEDRNTIKELSRSDDGCVMYELENDAPVVLPYQVNHNSGNQAVRFFDVLMGTLIQSRSQYTTYTSSFEITGPPRRYSYLLVGTVYGDVQEIIWETMKSYIQPNSPYLEYSPSDPSKSDCPYDIYLTNTYGSVSKGCVTAKYTDRFFLSNFDALICIWKPEALTKEHFNENVLTEIKDQTVVEKKLKQGNISVMDCLNKFIEREQMPPEETWYCPNCKQHLAPIKKFDVWTAPDVLIIHLKRFQYVPGVYFVHREKLSDLVDFPITGLDLRSYVKSSTSNSETAPPIYDLYAVSEHIGGMGGGHYTATAMNPINKKWYNFNDSSTHEVAAEEAISSKAYVLFYKRREGSLKWGGVIPLTEPLEN